MSNIDDKIGSDLRFTYPCLSNVLSTNTTTIRVYEASITEKEIIDVKDNPSSNVLVIFDMINLPDLEKEIEKENVLETDPDYASKYYIIFINEDIVADFSEKMSHEILASGVLRKGDIRDEATNILAG